MQTLRRSSTHRYSTKMDGKIDTRNTKHGIVRMAMKNKCMKHVREERHSAGKSMTDSDREKQKTNL